MERFVLNGVAYAKTEVWICADLVERLERLQGPRDEIGMSQYIARVVIPAGLEQLELAAAIEAEQSASISGD